jgi:Protein of unknown function (DUF3300)
MTRGRLTVLALCFLFGYTCNHSLAARSQETQTQAAPDPAALDKILAPIALYPDALVAQILFCSTDPNKIRELNSFIQKNKKLKGTELQEVAEKQGFGPSYCAIVIFPQVVKTMNDSIGWTRQLGQAFTADKKAVFASVQRLRSQAVEVGNLKTTPQQEVQTVEQGGQQVIVIQPSNPQVVYVPQYNPETVYVTQAPPATQTVVVHEDDDSDEIAAGLIGFSAGVALGATMNSSYYYGPYGWGGYGMHYGGYYGADWDDVADYREDRREDFYDHREDMAEELGDRSGSRSEQQASRQQASADRQASRQQTTSERQANRQSGTTASTTASASERQANRQSGTTPSAADRQASRQSSGASAGTQDRAARSSSGGAGVSSVPSGYSSRGHGSGSYGQSSSQTSRQSSSGAGAWSGYERGSSSRSSSSRGRSSMGGGGRGGGRRR